MLHQFDVLYKTSSKKNSKSKENENKGGIDTSALLIDFVAEVNLDELDLDVEEVSKDKLDDDVSE